MPHAMCAGSSEVWLKTEYVEITATAAATDSAIAESRQRFDALIRLITTILGILS
jgi:hypothetical protein